MAVRLLQVLLPHVLLQVLCLWQALAAVLGQSCSWTERKGWSGGAKIQMKIPVDQVRA